MEVDSTFHSTSGSEKSVIENPIMISALEHYSYCPRQCALIHVEQTFEENIYTMRGRDLHERTDKPEESGWEEGIRVDAITVQNEPQFEARYPSLVMTAPEQAAFIKNHLGPAFDATHINTKIVLFDHNWDTPQFPI